ncbi:hypothetical protein FACS1894109_10920 [Spirochaetia bacterium]|nr:hypothetical protein FACS1894109_10920 [Spirochaetia bacterium]
MKRYFNYTMAEKLCDMLSGSGLDSKPEILDDSCHKYVLITWDYHLMNERGYYDGYWYFTVRIPRESPMDFKVYGKRGNPRTVSACDTKEYLEQIIDIQLSEVLKDSGVKYSLVSEKIYPGDKDFNPEIQFAAEHGYHFGRAHYVYEGVPIEEAEYD